MSDSAPHPLARDYLLRLRRAGHRLPRERLDELCEEIAAHLRETIPDGASSDDALEVLERLGPPGDIVEAEQPAVAPEPVDRRTWREWAAIILLALGGFALGIGWLMGLILLWSSRAWNTRDKLIGTLIVPGGLASAVLVLSLGALTETRTESCSGQAAQINPATGAVIQRATMHCHTAGGPGPAAIAWGVALLAFFVLGPIFSAVYLARRAATTDRTAHAAILA